MRVDGVGGFRAQDVGFRMEDLIEIVGFRIQGMGFGERVLGGDV